MKKVTLLALHLGYGGVEKSIINLANLLCNDYSVEIISIYKLYDKPAFFIDKKVKVKYLLKEKPNKKELKESFKSFNLLKFLKEAIYSLKVLYKRKKQMKLAIENCNSEIIISSRVLFNNWLNKNKKINITKIGWEHNHHNNNNKYIRKIVKSCNRLNYLVTVSKELEVFYKSKLINSKCKVIYIPNLVNNIGNKSKLKGKNFISIGRLSPEKGFLELIDIFNDLLKLDSKYVLNIVGDGEEREKIEKKIKEYGIDSSVKLHGFCDEEYINKLLENQSLYLMTSYTESFGIVLIEAMNKGIPCVAFSSAQGANEIISNNKNGYLIRNRNKELFVKKVKYLMDNPEKKKLFSKNAILVGKNFSSEEVMKKWSSILNNKNSLEIKTLFISSTGGHLSELLQLEELFKYYNYHIITEKTKSTVSLKEKYNDRIDYLVYGTKAKIFSYMYKFPYNCFKSLYLYFKIKPRVIVTTGAHTAVPMCYIGKIFGSKIIFIETLANIETKTLSGRMVYPIADLFIVQWENMLKYYPKAVLGGKMY